MIDKKCKNFTLFGIVFSKEGTPKDDIIVERKNPVFFKMDFKSYSNKVIYDEKDPRFATQYR